MRLALSLLLGSGYCHVHPMNELIFINFLNGKWEWIMYIVRPVFFHDLCFCECVEKFILLYWNPYSKHINMFYSRPLVHIPLCFSLHFTEFYFIVIHAHHFEFQWRMEPPRLLKRWWSIYLILIGECFTCHTNISWISSHPTHNIVVTTRNFLTLTQEWPIWILA